MKAFFARYLPRLGKAAGCTPDTLPTYITLEIMSICNLQCRHCYLYNSTGMQQKLMDFERFTAIAQRLGPLLSRASSFNVASVEGLLHPQFFDMVALVRDYNPALYIPVYSNGMIIDAEKVERMLAVELHDIFVSLDGSNKKTVEAFKTGVNFERVIDGMKTVKRVAGNKMCLTAVFVAHKHNILELLDYIDLCRELKVDRIDVTGFISYDPSFSELPIYSDAGNAVAELVFKAAEKKGRKYGISVYCRTTRLRSRDFSCGAAQTMYVDENGNVVPCVVLARPTTLALRGEVAISEPIAYGNVLQDDPEKIWQSSRHTALRRQLHDGLLPATCRLCPMACGVIC